MNRIEPTLNVICEAAIRSTTTILAHRTVWRYVSKNHAQWSGNVKWQQHTDCPILQCNYFTVIVCNIRFNVTVEKDDVHRILVINTQAALTYRRMIIFFNTAIRHNLYEVQLNGSFHYWTWLGNCFIFEFFFNGR